MMSERHWWGGGADKIRKELPWTIAQNIEFASSVSSYELRDSIWLSDIQILYYRTFWHFSLVYLPLNFVVSCQG